MKKREPAGESRNRRRKILPLAACLLTAAIVATAVQIPNVTAKAEALDLDRGGSLTIVPSADEGFANDLYEEVAFDVYKVAKAVKASGYDSFDFDVLSGYEKLEESLTRENLSEIKNDGWRELAQEAAKIALSQDEDGNALITPTAEGLTGFTQKDLDAGLYLIVARDTNSSTGKKTLDREAKQGAGEEDQKKETAEAAGSAGEEAGSEWVPGFTTRVLTERYDYAFEPQLVSLPGRPVAGADGTVVDATSNTTADWQYDVTATLKPTRVERFGDLKITKTLTGFETKEPVEPATFVFEVEATRDGQMVYSDVVTATFTGAGEQEITLLDKIPVDAQITVKEVYSGAVYTVQGSAEKIFGEGDWLTSADDMLETEFTNTYNSQNKGGHGIVNSFTYDGNGWNWTSSPEQAPAE